MAEQKLFIISSHPNKSWWGQCKCKKVSGTKIGERNKNGRTKIGGRNKKKVSRTKIGQRNKKRSAEQKLVSGTKTAEKKLVGGTKKRSVEQKLVSTVSGTKIIYQVMW